MTLMILAIGAALLDAVVAVSVDVSGGTLDCGTAAGGSVVSCLGVPFAAPPVGVRRWAPPQPSDPWAGTRPAKVRQPVCIQGGQGPVPGHSAEDCLYLDVYAPRNATNASVLVWIHGGSYSTGSAPNGTMLVALSVVRQTPIVFVGVNYRLNVFGFLGGDELRSRSPDSSTGNYGLQDQRAALRWVRENAGFFGGDPSRITIDGCSAGAGSTANHLVNRRSWPYFDQVAGMSGMLSTWNTSPMLQAQTVYNGVLAAAKCSSAACLAGLNATVLAAAATKAHASVPKASWAPAVDGVETLGSPFNLSNAGVMHSGPVLFGTARDETCSLEGRTWSFHLDAQEFEAYLQKAVPEANASKLVQLYGNQIRPSTTRAHRPVSPYWWSAIEWSSDFAFHCPSRHLARGLTSHARTAFLFSYNVSLEMWRYYSGGVQCTPHCAELAGILFNSLPDTTAAGRLVQAIAAYHISFVRHGDPNPERDIGSPEWPAYSAAAKSMLFALPTTGGIRVESDYRAEACAYWDSLPGEPD